MNDSLRYLQLDPVYRQYHHNLMTFAMVYAYSENFMLPISHDEVVHGKGSMVNKIGQDDWRKFATLRAFYAFMWAFPGKQLIFMGCEFGQRREFNESMSLEWWVSDLWGHHGLQRLFQDLNRVYREHRRCGHWTAIPRASGGSTPTTPPPTCSAGCAATTRATWWPVSSTSQPSPRHVLDRPPQAGVWTEILNTDAMVYDGTNTYGNMGQVTAYEVPVRGFEASATVAVPALGAVWLHFEPEQQVETSAGGEA